MGDESPVISVANILDISKRGESLLITLTTTVRPVRKNSIPGGDMAGCGPTPEAWHIARPLGRYRLKEINIDDRCRWFHRRVRPTAAPAATAGTQEQQRGIFKAPGHGWLASPSHIVIVYTWHCHLYGYRVVIMAHTIEPASSGRAKCRGCGGSISKDELRFGERLPNPFADDGDMTLWFHPRCAAYKRPEALQEVIDGSTLPDRDELMKIIEFGIAHRRLVRADGVQRAPSARARCRQCRKPIAKGDWRIPLAFFEDGMFNASGYVHTGCSTDYFGTADLIERIRHFASDSLGEEDLESLAGSLR